MKNVDKIYNNTLHIITPKENQQMFKKMILENPLLYFTECYFNTAISKKKLKAMELEKRKIYIIDYTILCKMLDENPDCINILLSNNIHLFIISDVYSSDLINLYKSFGNNKIFINKKSKLKTLQNKLYKNLIKNINNEVNDETFKKYLDNEDLDIHYIILKNTELRYN